MKEAENDNEKDKYKDSESDDNEKIQGLRKVQEEKAPYVPSSQHFPPQNISTMIIKNPRHHQPYKISTRICAEMLKNMTYDK